MVLCFAALTLALATLHVGPRWLPAASLAVGFVLSVSLFLFEVHSAKDGFAMPWLQG